MLLLMIVFQIANFQFDLEEWNCVFEITNAVQPNPLRFCVFIDFYDVLKRKTLPKATNFPGTTISPI